MGDILRIPNGGIGNDVLETWNANPITDLTWTTMMALFRYPQEGLMKNVTFIALEDQDRAFPYRAILKTPVEARHLDGYRICPNFPDLCINEQGHVRNVLKPEFEMDKISISVEKLGRYYLARVPGRSHPQFVSHIRLYGDAWCGPTDNPFELTEYIPKDGNYKHLTPQNVRRATRWKKGQLNNYNKNTRDNHAINDWARINGTLGAAMKKQVVDITDDAVWDNDCFPANIAIVNKNKFGNCIDWCYNKYWVICVMDKTTQKVYCATNWRDLEVQCGLSKKDAKILLKKSRPDDEITAFYL